MSAATEAPEAPVEGSPLSEATPSSPPASPASNVASPAAMPSFTVGIDVGSLTARVAILNSAKPMPTIMRNELGNEATSTVVSFAANEARSFGENASARQVTKASETVIDLVPWISGYTKGEQEPKDSSAALRVFSPADAMSETATLIPRRLGTHQHDTHPAQAVAFYIKSLLRSLPDVELIRRAEFCVALPSAAGARAFEAYRQATLLAGVPEEHTLLAPSDEATAAYFHHLQFTNLPETHEDAAVPVVLIDIGQSCSVASLIMASRPRVEKVISRAMRMGSEYIDVLLCNHVYNELHNRFGNAAASLRGDIKAFRKILRECRKTKEVLSTTEKTQVQLEGLPGDLDIVVPVTRAEMDEAAKPFLCSLSTMLTEIKEKLPLSHTTAGEGATTAPLRVEVVGGGWRSVCITEVIKAVFGITRVGVSLDANLAVAEGSAILAEVRRQSEARSAGQPDTQASVSEAPSVAIAHQVELIGFEALTADSLITRPLSEEAKADVAKWAVLETQMESADALVHERLDALNRLDSYVLQLLVDVDNCAASTEKKTEIKAYLEEVDNFVRSEGDEASTAELTEKLAAVQAHITSNFPEIEDYYETRRAEERKREEELVKLSKERQEEESDLKSDPQRLRMAQKRREQGQGLFKEECWAEAQTRFVQALSILGQLYDTSSDENKTKKREISLSCHLNIASCSVKLGLWRNAVNNCTNALDLVPDHPKALFRRGQAYNALKEFKEAVADLEKAKAASNDDPAVIAELNKAKAALEAEKAREKKMFAKMFS